MSTVTWIDGGTLSIIDKQRNWNPQDGWQTSVKYAGFESEVEAFAQQLFNARIKFVIHNPREITATFDDDGSGGGNGSDEYSENWDLTWQEEQAKLRYNPYFQTNITEAEKREIAIAEKELDEGVDYKTGTKKPIEIAPTRYTGAKTQKYAEKRLKGIDTTSVYRPILTQTLSGGSASQIQASNTDVGKIQAIAPNSSLHRLGGEIAAFQWLKLPAQKRMNGSKIEITQQYLGAMEWDLDLYN
jgi:hypothetical protein